MKLVLAIIHDEDSARLTTALNKSGFQVTKLASTGGFLRVGNTTMMIGVNEEKVDAVLKIIHEECHSRKQVAVANQPYSSNAESYVPYPIEVTSGGATIFVVDIAQFHKF